jgi:hypothetical protein
MRARVELARDWIEQRAVPLLFLLVVFQSILMIHTAQSADDASDAAYSAESKAEEAEGELGAVKSELEDVKTELEKINTTLIFRSR